MEPTLNMRMSYLSGAIGSQHGYGRGGANGERAWTTHQAGKVKQFLDSGLRWFYWPPPLPGETQSHSWSFLKPVTEITLAEGTSSYALPADFGGLDGPITLTGDSGTWARLEVRTVGYVVEQLARDPDSTGIPRCAAVEPQKIKAPGLSPRSNLIFYPTADGDYTAQVPYYLLANALTGDNDFAYGGPEHAETVLAACLAAGELLGDGVKDGPLQGLWMTRLAASVSLDRRRGAMNYGYNADHSDERFYGAERPLRSSPAVTFNGGSYT